MSSAIWRRGVFASVAIAWLLAHDVSAAPKPSFATPESAVQQFIKSLAASDFDGAMQAFQLDAILARVDAQVQDPSSPLKSRTLAGAAKIYAAANAADETKQFIYGVLLDKSFGVSIEATDANLQRFSRALDPARLKSLRIVRIDQPVPKTMNSAEGVAQAKQFAAQSHSEAWTERVVLLQLDGTYYLGGFTLLKDGGTWRISQLRSVYGFVGAPGDAAKKTTRQDYEEIIK